MQRNIVALTVLVGLAVGLFAFNAGADTGERGASLEQRVNVLEASADRQRRAIASLRDDNQRQEKLITKLLRFRTDANRRLDRLDRHTARLDNQGVYGGPIDNGQVQLGGNPADCSGEIAEWNAAGTSLGCVPPTP